MATTTTVLELAAQHPETIGARLAEQAARFPERTLLVTPERPLTYAQMQQLANDYACGFAGFGVQQSDVVCQLLPNCESFIVNWMALARLGAVQAPLNPEFTGVSLERLINLTEARVLIVDATLASSIADIADGLVHLERIIFRAQPDFTPDPRLCRFHSSNLHELAVPGSIAEQPDINFSDPLMLLFTSGTTGPSKAVEFSHRYALTYAAEYIEHWRLTEEDVMYTAYPLFHIDAAVSTYLTALHRGAKAVIMPRFSVSRFWNDVRAHGATVTTMMGAVATFLFNREPTSDDSDNPLRLALMAPVPTFWREFETRFGIKVVGGYGSTEACFPCWPCLDEPHLDDTFGKPCQHYEIRIGDIRDQALPSGVVGEVLVRPKRPFTMMTGYYKNPQATIETWRNLWHHSGDLGYLDEDGYLHFVGRMKDAIRRRGENISAFEVEEVLDQHPDILETAVIGVPSEYTEEEVKAIIVLRPDHACTPEVIAAWCEGRVPRYAVPRYMEFVDELPTTDTSKVQKSVLQDQWCNSQTYDLVAGGYLND